MQTTCTNSIQEIQNRMKKQDNLSHKKITNLIKKTPKENYLKELPDKEVLKIDYNYVQTTQIRY